MLRMRKHKKQNRKSGQSTVEYILLAAAVIAALVIFLAPSGPFVSAYNSALTETTSSMNVMGGRFSKGLEHVDPTEPDPTAP